MTTEQYRANQEILASIAWSSDRTTALIPMTQYTGIGLQFVWDSLTSAGSIDGAITVYISNDGVNFDEIGTATTISTTSGTQCLTVADIFYTYIKIIAVHNSITGGTLAISGTFK